MCESISSFHYLENFETLVLLLIFEGLATNKKIDLKSPKKIPGHELTRQDRLITDPPPINFTTLSKKIGTCDIWYVTCYTSHVTRDTWHVTCYCWWTFSQNFGTFVKQKNHESHVRCHMSCVKCYHPPVTNVNSRRPFPANCPLQCR